MSEPRPLGEGWILCRDPRLARLLETELAYLGVPAAVYPTMPPPSEEVCLVIADGDEFGDEACFTLAASCGCPLLVFGREEQNGASEAGRVVFLRRPFALAALEKAVIRLLPAAPYPRPSVAAAEALETVKAVKQDPKPAPPSSPPLSVLNGVATVGEHTVPLTPAEEAILGYLMTRAGQTVTREELATLLEGGGNIVDVYVCRLRAKIEKPLGRRMIWTVRGKGYQVK